MSQSAAISTTQGQEASSIFPLLAVLIWSGNTIVSKAATAVIAPMAIAFDRWLLATLVLTPFMLASVWRKRKAVIAHWPKLLLLAALGMAIYQGLAYEAAHTTTAINMGMIVAAMPLFSVLLSGLINGEAWSAYRLGGGLLSLVGLTILTTHGHPARLGQGVLHIGDGLMLIAVLSNALYGVLLRRWQLPLSTWQQLYIQAGLGTLILLPFWWLAPSSPITSANLPLILYAGLAASIGAPYCWMTGVQRLGAARASQFMNLLPIFVALVAWPLFNEQPQSYHLVGGVIVLWGVWLGQRPSRAQK